MKKEDYIIIDGTAFHKETSKAIYDVLNTALNNDMRLRLWYGDIKTGKSWNEENDVIGYVGRSTGEIKIPLLIKNSRSSGGGGILDNCIIKIVSTFTGRVLYQHPKFKQSLFEAVSKCVYQDGKIFARCKSEKQSKRLAQFMNGERHSK